MSCTPWYVLFVVNARWKLICQPSRLIFKTKKMAQKKSTPIPGLSFSWKRALGITQAKQKISRTTGIPMSKAGIERKIGNTIIKAIFGKK